MKKLRIGAQRFASALFLFHQRNLLQRAAATLRKAVLWFLLRWLHHWTGRRRRRMAFAAGGGR